MLNGMPIQTLTRIADSRATLGLLSQETGDETRCRSISRLLTTPVSWSRSFRQTTADTTIGTSQGSSSTARTNPESRKRREKNTASARPMTNWPSSEPRVKTRVCQREPVNSGLSNTPRQLSNPLNGDSPVKKVRGV